MIVLGQDASVVLYKIHRHRRAPSPDEPLWHIDSGLYNLAYFSVFNTYGCLKYTLSLSPPVSLSLLGS